MIYAAALVSAVCFSLNLIFLGVVRTASRAIAASRDAAALLNDHALGEEEKERLSRAASVELLTSGLSILIRAATAGALALVPVGLLDAVGLVAFEDVMRWIASWPGVASTTAVMAIACGVRIRQAG